MKYCLWQRLFLYKKEITPEHRCFFTHHFLVRGVISVLSCYLTSFGQPLFLQNVCLHLFLFCTLVLGLLFIFVFLFFDLFIHAELLMKTFWFLPVHRYHLSLSVTIYYHKKFHISISFLYKVNYSIFMQEGESV